MSASKQEYNRKRRIERSWDPDKVLLAIKELDAIGHPEERHRQILHDMYANRSFDFGAPNPWRKRQKVKRKMRQGTRVRGMGKCTSRSTPSSLRR